VVHSLTPLQAGGPLAGLVVDEWSEVIPHHREHTGLAFHYDAPNARPPQAVLLAVPPTEYQPTWDLETLEATVLEALDLARLRAVDPEALAGVPGVDHFLPALCFALNLSGDTISTDFTRAAVG
jgi:hypothetical protein